MAFQTWQIGDVKVTKVLEMEQKWPGVAIIPNATRDAIKAHDWLLGPFADADSGRMRLSFHAFCLEVDDEKIIVDTCAGNDKIRPNFEGLANLKTDFLDQMTEAGFGPDDVTSVICTHLHVDHVGWNTVDREDGTREVFFPNARFVFQQAEWDFWMTPEQLAQPANAHLVECVEPLRDSGRITFFDGEQALDTNISFISTPGHTPGHVSIGIMSAGERAVVVGDASHHPAQLIHPDWSPAFDTDPLLSAKTRDALFDRAIAEDRTWLAGHWDYPGIGKLVRLEGKRVFQAL